MKDHDFISICETKLDDADTKWIAEEFSKMGLRAYVKNRKNLTIWRSGGVLVAVRNDLCKYITQVEYTADFMIVLILDKGLFNFDKKIVFITAYIPPYNTKYSSIDHFRKISNLLLDYDPDDFYYLLVGDLNAHTSTETDLVTFDENIIRTLDLDSDLLDRLEIVQSMVALDIPIERSSIDQLVD